MAQVIEVPPWKAKGRELCLNQEWASRVSTKMKILFVYKFFIRNNGRDLSAALVLNCSINQ